MYPTLRFLLGLAFTTLSIVAHAQLGIVPNANAQQLAQKLVGAGVTISNIRLTGSSLSTAIFYNHNATHLGIDSGIVLTTGRVLTEGSHIGLDASQRENASNKLATAGDANLNVLVSPKPTYDAVSLEFDFIPVGDTVKFRYAFSSEEYPTFTCSNFNDVFAFFISGPGISGTKNIALVPGTSIPVAINSINDGKAGKGYFMSDCNSMGPGSPFTQYFVDNADNAFFSHNGHTTVLTAAAPVLPCQVYHLKIAIADADDLAYDSGVFLQAESLKSEPIHIISGTPMLGNQPYLAEGCAPGKVTFSRSRKGELPQVVNLAFGGSAVNGVDVKQIPSTLMIAAGDSSVDIDVIPLADKIAEGEEMLKIYLSNGCTGGTSYLDSIQILLRDFDTLAMTPAVSASICNQSSIQLQAGTGYDQYQWSTAKTQDFSKSRNAVTSEEGNFVCVATKGICQAKDSIRIQVKKMVIAEQKNINCLPSSGGSVRIAEGGAWQHPVQYAVDQQPFSSSPLFTGLSGGKHVLKMRDATGCTDSVTVEISSPSKPLAVEANSIAANCRGEKGWLIAKASGGVGNYLFSVDAGPWSRSDSFMVRSGDHGLRIKDGNGCMNETHVTVGADDALVFEATPSALVCNGNSDGMLFISAKGGSGSYEYATDVNHFQKSDSLDVATGLVQVTVRDTKGCESVKNIVVPLNEKVFVHAGPDTTICEGTSVRFPMTANAEHFYWAASDGSTLPDEARPMVHPDSTTTYMVRAVKAICTVYDTITVHVRPSPRANAGPDSTICLGATITLKGNGGNAYQWWSSSPITNPSSSQPRVKPVGASAYFLKVTDAAGCTSQRPDTVVIRTIARVEAFAGRDTIISKGQPVQLSAIDRKGNPVLDYVWSPPVNLNNAFVRDPVAMLQHDTRFEVLLTTPEGCEGRDSVWVRVFEREDLYVPSGFTPNGDGRNDRLFPVAVGMRSLNYFRVLNRWGQVVYQSNNFLPGWDGMINGKPQPEGTYLWFAEAIDYKGTIIRRQGTSTLLR